MARYIIDKRIDTVDKLSEFDVAGYRLRLSKVVTPNWSLSAWKKTVPNYHMKKTRQFCEMMKLINKHFLFKGQLFRNVALLNFNIKRVIFFMSK